MLCAGTSHRKLAWDCTWVTLTHIQRVHRGQLYEFHHINDVTAITREGDEIGSLCCACTSQGVVITMLSVHLSAVCPSVQVFLP